MAMYFDEKEIDGVLHWHGSIDGVWLNGGEWTPLTAKQLSSILIEQRRCLGAGIASYMPAVQKILRESECG
jgi:hypothetical protein